MKQNLVSSILTTIATLLVGLLLIAEAAESGKSVVKALGEKWGGG